MTDPPELAALDAATKRYRKTEAAHEQARAETTEAVVQALRAGIGPTTVAERSPFTAPHVRTIARAAGIPPAKPGLKKKTEPTQSAQ